MRRIPRSLRLKTLLAVSLTLVGLLGALYLACRVIILGSSTEVEHQIGQRNLRRAQDYLNERIARLGAIAESWTRWDDAQTFVQTPEENHINANLSCLALRDIRIDTILYLNAIGQVVFERSCDRTTDAIIPVAEGLLEQLGPGSKAFDAQHLTGPSQGVLQLPEGPILFAVHPISSDSGQVLGALFVGQKLDKTLTEQISTITVLDVSTMAPNLDLNTDEYRAVQRTLLRDRQAYYIHPINDQQIASYGLISDIFAHPALFLRVQYPRFTYIQSQADVQKFLLFLLVSGLLAGAFVLFSLEYGILSRLLGLSAAVQRIGETEDLSLRVQEQGRDELASLQKTINRTLQRLAHSHSIVRSALDTTASGVLVVSPEGTVLRFNEQYLKLFDLTAAQLAMPPHKRLELLQEKVGITPQMAAQLQAWHSTPDAKGTGSWELRDGRVLEVCTVPLRLDGPDGELVGRLWDFRDITEHRRLEQLLRRQVSEQQALRAIAVAGSEATGIEALAELTAQIISQSLFQDAAVLVALTEPETGTLSACPTYCNGQPLPCRLTQAPEQSLHCRVLATGQPFRLGGEGAGADGCQRHPEVRSEVCVPLVAHKQVLGLLRVQSRTQGAFSQADQDLLTTLGGQLVTAMEKVRMFAEVQRLASTDGLTGLSNRRHFFSLAQQEIERAQRYRHPVSVLMADLDHFKSINDTFGHAMGDRVLQATAEQLRTHLRNTDRIGRYGGEEFAVLLPETNLLAACSVAERMRRHLEQMGLMAGDTPVKVTVSIGVAALGPDTPNLDKMMGCADKALYEAKRSGRNCIRLWRDGGIADLEGA